MPATFIRLEPTNRNIYVYMYNNAIWGFRHSLVPKIHASKIGNIQKDFQLYQVLCKFSIPKSRDIPIDILLRMRTKHFSLRISTLFGLEVSEQFGPKKIAQEKSAIFPNNF